MHIIVQYPPSQSPFIAYNITQYIFPTTHDPLYIAIAKKKKKNFILAISCKGKQGGLRGRRRGGLLSKGREADARNVSGSKDKGGGHALPLNRVTCAAFDAGPIEFNVKPEFPALTVVETQC